MKKVMQDSVDLGVKLRTDYNYLWWDWSGRTWPMFHTVTVSSKRRFGRLQREKLTRFDYKIRFDETGKIASLHVARSRFPRFLEICKESFASVDVAIE